MERRHCQALKRIPQGQGEEGREWLREFCKEPATKMRIVRANPEDKEDRTLVAVHLCEACYK